VTVAIGQFRKDGLEVNVDGIIGFLEGFAAQGGEGFNAQQ
jgi:hypothetical protein